MTSKVNTTLLAAVALAAATSTKPVRAQQPNPSSQGSQTSAGGLTQPTGSQVQTPFSPNGGESPEFARIVDTVVGRENQLMKNLRSYGPRVESYIQEYRPDSELGSVPVNDHYFLGRIDFRRGIAVRSFLPQPGLGKRIVQDFTEQISRLYSLRYQPSAFAYTIAMDTSRFDRRHYQFDFVRREFLGDIRCLVFDVKPKPGAGIGLFEGRIWVEDRDYNIVRFNGTYAPAPRFSSYFHFDSWRENVQPGLWLPVYVYSEESDLKYSVNRTLRFRAQTRLWGYDLNNPNHQQELTRVLVDAPDDVQDSSQTSTDPSPVTSEREWEREAQQNVLDRLERAGLLAPPGDVDKVMETVVNNLLVTNHVDNAPQVHCRVLLTSPLESVAIGNTIILSRGLIDVLPDEPSLAAMLAHELGHIVLQHTMNTDSTKYAFQDRLLMTDEDVLSRLNFRPNEREEAAADQKALEILKNSPYKDQLSKAGLFLRAMADAAPHTPQLFGSHLGSRLVQGSQVRRVAELMGGAPQLQKTRVDQIAALPLGARVKVDAWSDRAQLVKGKPVALLSAREKMPFEVTPMFPYLTRVGVAEQQAGGPPGQNTAQRRIGSQPQAGPPL
jgi:hypothetical protein